MKTLTELLKSLLWYGAAYCILWGIDYIWHPRRMVMAIVVLALWNAVIFGLMIYAAHKVEDRVESLQREISNLKYDLSKLRQ